MNLLPHACIFIKAAHGDQVKKYTGLDGMHYMVQEQPIWHTASILYNTSYGILKEWKGYI